MQRKRVRQCRFEAGSHVEHCVGVTREHALDLARLACEEMQLGRAFRWLMDHVQSEHIIQCEPRNERIEILERGEQRLRLAEIVKLQSEVVDLRVRTGARVSARSREARTVAGAVSPVARHCACGLVSRLPP